MLTNKVRADYLFGNKVHGLASVTWHPCIYSLSILQRATIVYTWREKQRKRMEKKNRKNRNPSGQKPGGETKINSKIVSPNLADDKNRRNHRL